MGSFQDKIEQSVKIYNKLCDYYDKFMITDNAKGIVKTFDNLFPQYGSITNIKKVDLAIWSLGVKPKSNRLFL